MIRNKSCPPWKLTEDPTENVKSSYMRVLFAYHSSIFIFVFKHFFFFFFVRILRSPPHPCTAEILKRLRRH